MVVFVLGQWLCRTFAGLQQRRIKSIRVHIGKAMKSLFVFLLQDQIISRGRRVMFIGLNVLACQIAIIAMLADLIQDKLVNRNPMLPDYNARDDRFFVKLVEFVVADFLEGETFLACCE